MARLKSNDTPLENEAAAPVYRLDSAGTQATAGTPYLLEDSIGTGTWEGKPIFDHEQVIGQLDVGSEIDGKTITFSFFDGPHTTGLYNKPADNHSEPAGYSPLSEAEKAAARQSMALWDDLIVQDVVEKNGDGADVVFANTTTADPVQAWAYFPGEGHGHKVLSDVWMIDPTQLWDNAWVSYGGYGRYTLVHEIGHALGLNHPGDYNAGDSDGDGVPNPVSYANNAVYAQDTQQYTVMSYFMNMYTGGDTFEPSLLTKATPQTPLLHDILAIQAKYGADPTTRAGDTVYFANSTAGNGVFDLAENPFPFLSVYDAGGNDTFDFSTANTGVFLDLRAGSFSSASAGYLPLDEAIAAMEAYNALKPEGAPMTHWNPAFYEGWIGAVMAGGASHVEADTGIAGVSATMNRNISIAYNTVIENAAGGAARDYLVGNDVANVLEGNAGDDVLNGLGGDDTLWGGEGADEFRFFDRSGIDTIADFVSGIDTINLAGIDADTGTEGDEAFSFVGDAAFSGKAGELRSHDGFLAGDVNGDGLADFIIGIGAAPIVQGDIVF